MTDSRWKNLALEVIGCFVSALGLYSFAVAAGVPVTGVAGIGAILFRLFGLPIGVTNIIMNIPMVLFAFFTDYVLAALPVYQGDRMLATICGGVIGGIGDALIYMQNSSTGGLDFITMAIKPRHPHMPFGNLTFAAALAVILANGLVFHDVDSIIYGLIFNFLTSYIINRMMFGFNACMMALIVTSDGPAVCRMIGEKVDRGSTILKGYGGYSQDGRDVVLCACSGKEMFTITREVKLLDPASFTIILESNEVHGEGFRMLRVAEPHAGDEK